MNSHPPGKSGRLATFWYAPRDHHSITTANLAKKEKLWHQELEKSIRHFNCASSIIVGLSDQTFGGLLLLGSRIRRNSSASAWSYAILSNGKIMNKNYSTMILTRQQTRLLFNNMLSEWHDLIAIQFHSPFRYILHWNACSGWYSCA